MAKLAPYRAKRDFTRTQEPKGRQTRAKGSAFVVQKHAARRLHYDFRLELDGVLKSWAVAKGPSLVAGEKRLAVHVEDHPLDYGNFEGAIPAGEYGGGTVMLWDRGRWEPEGDPRKGYAKGHLTFILDGEKLHGAWHLVRMRKKPRERQESWLLIKSDDEFARSESEPDILDELPLSVKTGRSMDEIASGAAGGAAKQKKAANQKKVARSDPPAGKPAAAKGRSPAKTSPLPRKIEPSLATLVDRVPKGPRWLHEIKWDGYRLIAFVDQGKVRLQTRNGLDWTERFPAIAKAVATLPVRSAVIDGEAVVEDENGVSSFAALQQALSNTSRGVADAAVFYAFDLLYLDGDDWRARPLAERKARLADLLAGAPGDHALRLSEHLDDDGPAMVRNACRLGLEGVVSKRRDRPYRSGRTDDWVKTKCTDRQEFVIAGYVPSTAIKNAVGSLVLGYFDKGRLVYAGRTGTGFTADSARDLARRLQKLRRKDPAFDAALTADQRRGAVWVEPELIGEVEFRGWTGDNVIRHAAFKGLREDKTAREVGKEAGKEVTMARSSTKTKAARSGEVAGIALTHPDRILWEEQGITKQGLAEYYVEVADWILPHVVDRPLALVRCPSGSQKGCFFQKHSWAGLADHILRDTVRNEKGEEEVLLVRDIKGVVSLVQAGVLEIHPWGATMADIEHPDRITFDFDPAEDVAWGTVIDGARELRERLRAVGLDSFAKTTGGKGLHVVVPLLPEAGWDEVKSFARQMAEAMEADNPGRYLTKATKKDRKGRIFIDYLRNGRGATAVAAYSTRARPGAPVSTPLSWDELSPAIRSNHFTVTNLPSRLAALPEDPWASMSKLKQRLPPAQKRSSAKKKRS
jgi:bifunctional non-homologous end joining protein LigD